MKFIHYGDGTRYGDPNVYWGSPSYRLEPGDPGYVAYSLPATNTKHTNTMAKQPYMPIAESDKVDLLDHLADCLLDADKGYATRYGSPPPTSPRSITGASG